jgi:hypothetical protein
MSYLLEADRALPVEEQVVNTVVPGEAFQIKPSFPEAIYIRSSTQNGQILIAQYNLAIAEYQGRYHQPVTGTISVLTDTNLLIDPFYHSREGATKQGLPLITLAESLRMGYALSATNDRNPTLSATQYPTFLHAQFSPVELNDLAPRIQYENDELVSEAELDRYSRNIEHRSILVVGQRDWFVPKKQNPTFRQKGALVLPNDPSFYENMTISLGKNDKSI